MESPAEGVPRRQFGPSHLPALGAPRRVRSPLGRPARSLRGLGRLRLGVAGRRRGDGQGQDGGDLIGPNPTDRGKKGVKRSLLVEKDGGPLAVVIAGANVPDAQLLAATIDAVAVERPEPEPEYPQHLCLDKGYDNPRGWGVIADHDYTPHIQLIRDLRPPRKQRFKPRRWVVERTLAWLSKCRAILIRWDKKACNYLGLLKLACALLWFRRYHRLATLR
jgi:putative transposase